MTLPAILLCLSAEIVDLGVLTPQRAFVLERNSNRPDFSHFEAEFISFPSSNRMTLRLTNDLLTISEVAALPSGRTVLGLISVWSDGQSAASFYRFDIRREPPAPPIVRPTALSSTLSEKQGILRAIRQPKIDRTPPLPFTPTNRPQASVDQSPPPLPNGNSRTYGQHLDRMAEFYTPKGKRRNQ